MALAFQYRVPGDPPSRIALFPGAWNPPTIAHVAMARAALRHAGEVVWLLPREFPHKTFEGATFAERLEMLRLIAEREAGFSVAVTDGGLYIEMADEAREYFGAEPEIALLCGRDAAERIAAWDYGKPGVFEDMIARYPLLVAGRAGGYLPHPRHSERVIPITISMDEISSTDVRAGIAAGRPWRHLVPPVVVDRVEEIYLAG